MRLPLKVTTALRVILISIAVDPGVGVALRVLHDIGVIMWAGISVKIKRGAESDEEECLDGAG